MSLAPGTRLGPYEILGPIGKGGMGEVYKAWDTRLNRDVAIKILPQAFATESARERFQREARAASALNHPNICTVYDIGESDGQSFIAMEYLEGQTLSQIIGGKPLTTSQITDLAMQVTDALNAAHAKRVVHRDIKPANIFVTSSGQVKVMDFGVAKHVQEPNAEARNSASDTEAMPEQILTTPGSAVGTVAYMSPEQALGLEVDARTDLFSFGVVLYEMSTGVLPFHGGTTAALFDAILHTAPVPPARLNPHMPPELERIITKAVEKDRKLRYQTASDLRADLARLQRDTDSSGAPVTPAAAPVTATRRGVPAYLLAGLLVVVAVLLYLLLRPRQAAKPAQSALTNVTFTQLTDLPGEETYPSLSPDGRSFVYASRASGNWAIYLQRVGGKNPVNLTKNSSADDTQPAFSPDGDQIVFRSERDGGGIFVMGATGESVRRLSDFGYHPAWSPDGKEIVVGTEGPEDPTGRFTESQLWGVSVESGKKRQITKPDVVPDAVQPNWSPHGDRIAYWALRGGRRDIWTVAADGTQPVAVTDDPPLDWNPVWSPDGNYLYFSSNRGGSMNLWRVRMQEKSGQVLGPPEAITTPSPFSGPLSISRDGKRIAYVQQTSTANIEKISFDPVKEVLAGAPQWVTQGSRRIGGCDPSPDGEWLAFDTMGSKQEDIFVIKADGSELRQLTNDAYRDRVPRWSPDGKRIAFMSDRSGAYQIWMINADGSGLQQITYESRGDALYPVWSGDGTRLAYSITGVGAFLIDAGKPWKEQAPKPAPQPGETGGEFYVVWSWSPNGQKLAGHLIGAGGPSGVAVYSLESQKFERLINSGAYPVWLNDGRRLLFQNRDKLYLADSHTRKAREIFSAAPHSITASGASLSANNRMIYFSVAIKEADIWLADLQEIR
jgi:eukaryotic-like serine/threonine-protein kinase